MNGNCSRTVVNPLTGSWQALHIAGGGHAVHGRGITPLHPPHSLGIRQFQPTAAVSLRALVWRAAPRAIRPRGHTVTLNLAAHRMITPARDPNRVRGLPLLFHADTAFALATRARVASAGHIAPIGRLARGAA